MLTGKTTRWRLPAVAAGAAILLAFAAVMTSLTVRQDRMLERQQYDQAEEIFDLLVLSRAWNSGYGGVYVEKKPGVTASPFMPRTDIKATNGKTYVLKNPATMVREISDLSRADSGTYYRITSLNPLNPANAPDDWERAALQAFERGERERTIETVVGKSRFYRFMRPLRVDASCLPCHARQGYRIGDVRGGISVNMLFDEHWNMIRDNFWSMVLLTAAVGGLFTLALYYLVWVLLGRLALQTTELDNLCRTKDRFLGMAAHDLRNPLSVIHTVAAVLQSELKEESFRVLVNAVANSAKRMLSLVSDLLDVTKINTGQLALRLVPTDVAEFVRDAASFNAPLARAKSISLETDVAGDLGSAVFDPDRMRQVVDNLVSNAIKYSHPNSKVTIGSARRGDVLSFWVRDRGLGIKQTEIPKLFGEFAKAGSVPTAGESSYGLGLAISKRLVEMHEGRIEVSSEPGKGSTFTVLLPVKGPSR